MYNFKNVVGAAALLLATSAVAGGPEVAPAPVVDNSGFYIGVNGGLNLLARNNNNWDNGFLVVNGVALVPVAVNNVNNFWNYNTAGWNIGAALGYRYNNWRVELEGSYMQHSANNTWFGFNLNNAFFGNFHTRNLDIVTVLLNGYYDFDMGNNFVPYVGLGLGWGQTQTRWNFGFANVVNPFAASWTRNGFAFQGVLGLDYKVTDNVRIGVSYHAVGLANGNNNGRLVALNGFNFAFGNHNIGFENKFNLGLSYFF